MKIYNEIILQWNEETQSYETVYEDSFDYTGELMHMSSHLADAGADQTVYINSTVNLDSSASQLGEIVAYEWVQLIGTAVMFDDEASNPSFTAPSSSDELTFRLTIWDPGYNEYTDEVTISVIEGFTTETIFVDTDESGITDIQCSQACDYGNTCVNYNQLCSPVSSEIIDDECYCGCSCPPEVVNDEDDNIITEDDYDVITAAINYRILKDYPYKNAYGQYAHSSADEFYLNTGINSKEFGDDLYVTSEIVGISNNKLYHTTGVLYCPGFNFFGDVDNTSIASTNLCESGYAFDDPDSDFDVDLNCCFDVTDIKANRFIIEIEIAHNQQNLQIYYDKNTEQYINTTAPNLVKMTSSLVNDSNTFLTTEITDLSGIVGTIYIAEWGDENSTTDKESMISQFLENKYIFENIGLESEIYHFYQTPGIKKIRGFTEYRDGPEECPYFVGNLEEATSFADIKTTCNQNINCDGYLVTYNIQTGYVHVWYSATITNDYTTIKDNAQISVYVGEDLTTTEALNAVLPNVVMDYCTRFAATGDSNHAPWGLYESFSIIHYFEAKIHLNVDEVYKDEFEEIGGTGFDYLPWPSPGETPTIGGLSDESKYINDVINIVNQNQFKETEVLDKLKATEALENDELGDHLGKVDLAQTRVFKGAYDMDYLLMIQNTLAYEPYYDIYDEETNPDGYWDGETEETIFSDESCVGLIFITDSTNSILRDNCIVEFNFGDSQDDIVIDTSGQNNKGIIIGDYSLQKSSKEVPLIKDDVMSTPTTDTTDGAF
jgi:hypothetical protein